VGIFLVASLAVGARLLALAARTRELPELALGSTLFIAGGLGGILYFLGTSHSSDLGALGLWVRGLGRLCLSVGALSLWGFTWRVFRPGNRAATALFCLAACAIAIGFAGEALAGGFRGGNFDTVWSCLGFVARGLAYCWASLESLRYFGLMRRRFRIGLADPLLVNRFLLWGIATTAAFGIYVVALINLLDHSAHDVAAGVFSPTWALSTSVLGLTSGVCLWLAFLAPAGYRRWIASHASGA
jgi:hypothetical protein